MMRLGERQSVAALASACLIACAAILWYYGGTMPWIFADEQVYSSMARLTPLSDAGIASYLYLAVFRLASFAGDQFLLGARVLNLALVAGAVPFIYLTARRYCPPPVAALIGASALASPFHIYTVFFIPESMYFFLFWATTWLALAVESHAVLIGVALGALMLTKVHGLFLLPSAALFIVARGWAQPQRAIGAAALALAVALGVKFGVSYAVAGAKGLTLLGSFYENLASDGVVVPFAKRIAGLLPILRNHAMLLVLVLAVPLAACIAGPWRDVRTRRLRLYTLLMFAAAFGLAVLYTSSAAALNPGEGPRVHARYYSFAFPLLMILAWQANEAPRRRRLALAALLGVGLLYARLALPRYATIFLADTPELAMLGLGRPDSLADLLLALELLLLAVWSWKPSRGMAGVLALFLPLLCLHGAGLLHKQVEDNRIGTFYDRAGIYVRQHVPADERNAMTVIGTDMGSLLRTKFHIDAPDVQLADVPWDWPVDPSAIPGRQRWLLVLSQHAMPDGMTPHAQTPEFRLYRLTPNHTPLGEADFSQPIGGLLDRADGLSHAEHWGRWSDAKQVRLRFARPLPKQLNVYLGAQAFGPNAGQPFVIRVGGEERRFSLTPMPHEVFFRFDTDGQQRELTIEVPQPVSPQSLGMSVDDRQLGIGISKLGIGERR